MNRICLLFLLAVVLVVAIVSVGATGGSGSGLVAISDSSPIGQNFNALANSGTTSTVLPEGWYLTEIGTGAAAEGAYVVGTGASNAGGAYSFGGAGAVDRALGSVGSGSATSIVYGAEFTNTGSGPITALSISFVGEMWRRGPSTTPDGLTFSYSTTASSLTTGSFTNVNALTFVSPGNTCQSAAGATDGNAAACRSAISGTLSGLAVNPGSSIWIRWTDTDTAGSDDGVAIDDVSVTATFSTDPTPPTATATASPNPANPGQQVTLHGSISPGFNPFSQSYTVVCDLSPIGGSSSQVLPNDGSTFTYVADVPARAALGAATLACSVTDDQTRSSTFSIPLTILLQLNDHCGAAATPISSIQGSGPFSLLSEQIVDVEAIVVGDFHQASNRLSGFYIEAPTAEQDGNPATSEGVFVFSSTPVNVGERVRVRGTVAEFQSSTGSAVSNLTEVSGVSSVQMCAVDQPLPAPVDLMLPIDDQSDWERYEGMEVRFRQQLVVTGNFSLGQFGQIDLAPSVLFQPTQRVGSAETWAAAADLVRRSRIALDDGSTLSNANLNEGGVAPYPPPGLSDANTLRVGALVNPNGGNPPVPLDGILDDRFGAYRIQPTSVVTFSNVSNPRPDTSVVAATAGARFRIVSANVLNFFTTLGSRGAATAEELTRQRAKIVAELSRLNGDVIGLSELQNFANGQTNGGTYTNAAIADLTAALALVTGRDYQFLDTIDSANLVASNAVADNGTDAIRSGITYDASRVTPVGYAALFYQGDQNRPTLAQTFQPAAGIHPEQQSFTVVVNHFRSKGSPCGPGNDDVYQGNCNGMRLSMANNVAAWLDGNPTLDPAGANRRYVLIGDFNAYFGEDPIQALVGTGRYTNLINLLLGEKAYSYNFGSQDGYLDHALVNPSALPLVKDVAELHINADEPAALQALDSSLKSASARAAYYAPNEFAASDHDPIVIGFNPLAGDFSDDGTLDATDRTALLAAINRGRARHGPVDRRMDMNQDGVITQDDFHVWQRLFISWQQGRK